MPWDCCCLAWFFYLNTCKFSLNKKSWTWIDLHVYRGWSVSYEIDQSNLYTENEVSCNWLDCYSNLILTFIFNKQKLESTTTYNIWNIYFHVFLEVELFLELLFVFCLLFDVSSCDSDIDHGDNALCLDRFIFVLMYMCRNVFSNCCLLTTDLQ